jgi:hypothetical protein
MVTAPSRKKSSYWNQYWVYCLVCLMLAQNVSRIIHIRLMHHDDIFGHDCLLHPVKRECIVAFMKLGMRVSGTLNNGLLVSKDVADIV